MQVIHFPSAPHLSTPFLHVTCFPASCMHHTPFRVMPSPFWTCATVPSCHGFFFCLATLPLLVKPPGAILVLCLPTAMALVSIVLIKFATAQFLSHRVSFSSYSCPATQEAKPCLHSNIFSRHLEVPTSFSQHFDSSRSRLYKYLAAELPSILGLGMEVGSSAPPTVH